MNVKKLKSWIKDFLIEEHAILDWGIENAVDDITQIVLDWLGDENNE